MMTNGKLPVALICLAFCIIGLSPNAGSAPLQLGHSNSVTALAFSPDGRLLASGGWDGMIKLWSMQGGELLHTLEQGDGWITALAFAPDGHSLAGATKAGTLRLWDMPSGRLQWSKEATYSPYALAFSPDGRILASSGWAGYLDIWDVEKQQRLQVLKAPASDVTAMAFSPDGKTIVQGSDYGQLHLWDIAAGTMDFTLQEIKDHIKPAIVALAFSQDGKAVIAADVDGIIRHWSLADRALLRTDSLPAGGSLKAAALLPGLNQAVFVDGRSQVQLVRLTAQDTSQQPAPMDAWQATPPMPPGKGAMVALSMDGKMMACGYEDGRIVVWDTSAGRIRLVTGQSYRVNAVVCSRDGRTLVAAFNSEQGEVDAGVIAVWDLRRGQPRYFLRGHTRTVLDLALSPDERTLASASLDGTVRLWELADRKTGRILQVGPDANAVAFAPVQPGVAATIIATGQDHTDTEGNHSGELKLWDLPTGRMLQHHRLPSVRALAFLSRHVQRPMLAVADGTSAPSLWDFRSGLLRPLQVNLQSTRMDPYPLSVAPASNSDMLVTNNWYGEVHLWDLTKVSPIQHFKPGPYGFPPYTIRLRAVDISPDGKRVIGGNTMGVVHLWDSWSGREEHRMSGHHGWLRTARFAPSGDIIISSGGDSSVKFWKSGDGRLLLTLSLLPPRGPAAVPTWLASTPEGHYDGTATPIGIAQVRRSGLIGQVFRRMPLGSTSPSPPHQTTSEPVLELRRQIVQPHLKHTFIATGFARASKSVAAVVRTGSQQPIELHWYDTSTGVLQHKVEDSTFKGAIVAGHGRLLVSTVEDQVQVWDIQSRQLARSVQVPKGENLGVMALSPDGSMLATSRLIHSPHFGAGSMYGTTGEIKLWNTQTGALIKTLSDPSGHITCLSFSADGKLLSSGSARYVGDAVGGAAQLWDVVAGTLLKTMGSGSFEKNGKRVYFGPIRAIAMSPDGSLCAARCGGGSMTPDRGDMLIWNIVDGALKYTDSLTESFQEVTRNTSALSTSPIHPGASADAIAFSADSRRMALNMGGAFVMIYDLTAGKTMELLAAPKPVTSLEFSVSGVLAGACQDDVKLWQVL